MGIIINKNIPILKTKEQCRKNDFLRGMCRYVTTRHKIDQAISDPELFKGKPDENKAK